MRNRILAGLGVAALATVGVAAPANAISSSSADLYVVHAVPGQVVDVFVNGEPFAPLQNFQPGTVAGPVDLPAGSYDIAIALDGGTLADAVITATVPLAANMSYTAVAHPTESGELTLSPFVNDISKIAAGQGKVTVRHTAEVTAVDVRSTDSGDALVSNFSNGDDQQTLTVPAGTIPDVYVAPTGTTDRAIELGAVTVPAGTHLFVHAYGPLANETFEAIVFQIDNLHSTPTGVPAGEAGLGQQSNSGLIAAGAALLLALAAAAVVVRRQTVGAER